MSRIFWDSHLFIYLFGDFGDLSDRVVKIRERMLQRGDQLCTSALTLGEILVKALEQGDDALARSLEAAVVATALVIPFDVAAAAIFARLQANGSITAPDAVQLACAAQARTDLFITNDDRLTVLQAPGVQFISSLASAPV